MIARLVGFLALASVASIGTAHAQIQNNVSTQKEKCVVKVGPEAMRLTGYQPRTPKEVYCDSIPATGATEIVLEAIPLDDEEQKQLRDMAIELRIIRDIGPEAEQKAKLEDITEAYAAPAKHQNGIVTLHHDFNQAGRYVGVITAKGPSDVTWVARFPFDVGASRSSRVDWPLIVAVGGGVLAVGGSYLVYLFRRFKAAKRS
jgi:hypothetical protein